VALGGCVSSSSTTYPTDWPQVVTARHPACAHLRGQFSNEAVLAAPAEKKYARLMFWLAGRDWEIRSRVFTAVELQVHDGRLAVRMLSPEHADSVDVPIENWRCESGQLVGHPPAQISGEHHAVMNVSGRVVLDRGANNSLVVHVESKETGVSMIVPFRESSESWFQYPAISSQASH
jgi:hypothetical protein